MEGHIYTRTGDDGTTGLAGGSRVAKDSVRVEAYGAVDEACSHVGLARAGLESERLRDILGFVQNRLLNCASLLATEPSGGTDRRPSVTSADVAALERFIDELTARTGSADGFVLPGGDEVAARLHVARAVTRRAERRIVTLAAAEPVDDDVRRFVNRLSDLLYAMARTVNHDQRRPEALWDPTVSPPTE